MIRLLTILALLLTATSQAAIYENLEYGDTRAEVQKKLLACPRLKATVPETMFGRVGLNGSFVINKDLNGKKFSLYFGWTDDGKLNEITLRSEPIPASEYQSTVQSTFSSAISLVDQIYGTPIMSNPIPPQKDLKEDSILNSHLWHPHQGSLMLGLARLQGKLHISIRFTQRKIQPVKTP